MIYRVRFYLYLAMAGLGFSVNLAAEQAHHHSVSRAVPEGVAPVTLVLEANRDVLSGYNLNLNSSNFRFSPENTGKHTDAFEGHAHLYINGKKIGRIYGNWFHITTRMLAAKTNHISVTLNDNEHKNWLQNGKMLEASISLPGAEEIRVDREIHLKTDFDAADIPVVESLQDQMVRFHLAAKPGQKIHLHGYDIEKNAAADGNVTMIVKLSHTGRFPIVVHVEDKLLGHTEKAFAYVEVRSR